MAKHGVSALLAAGAVLALAASAARAQPVVPPATNAAAAPWNGSTLGANAAASATVGENGNPTFGLLKVSARTLGPWGWGWSWGPPVYPVYAPRRGAVVGPGGAVAWGPGGWAGTTGNVYSRWGDVGAVTRTSQGYSAWTGNRWAGQVGMAYNSRTGVLAAGQRGAVANVYTGDYAAGARGAATGPGGITAAGRAGTVGNAYNGRQVTAGQGIVYDRNTGQATTGGFVKGDNGGAVRVGDDVYAGHDGNVYRRTDDGTWQQHTDGGWQNTNVQRPDNLDRDSTARDFGQQRFDAYRNSTQNMNRSFGGGGVRGGGGLRRR